ncbi:hypothetical protein L7F22_014461 [Adiantum nelumboides]|nr:hypothetical protein [Adiantum nelumboides]
MSSLFAENQKLQAKKESLHKELSRENEKQRDAREQLLRERKAVSKAQKTLQQEVAHLQVDREYVTSNFYMRPIEGITRVVDMDLEKFVKYTEQKDPTEGWFFKTYMDAGEYGFGLLCMVLKPLNDCPCNAHYMNVVFVYADGKPYIRPNMLYNFESYPVVDRAKEPTTCKHGSVQDNGGQGQPWKGRTSGQPHWVENDSEPVAASKKRAKAARKRPLQEVPGKAMKTPRKVRKARSAAETNKGGGHQDKNAEAAKSGGSLEVDQAMSGSTNVHNPNIVAISKEDLKYVSLTKPMIGGKIDLDGLMFLHSPDTKDDAKAITHLICIDASSMQGFQLLLQAVRYLMNGSKDGRVGILSNVGDARTMHAVFELEALMLTGHCHEQNDGPWGLQLLLGTKLNPHGVDTIVMANLGYWQLKAAPGLLPSSLVDSPIHSHWHTRRSVEMSHYINRLSTQTRNEVEILVQDLKGKLRRCMEGFTARLEAEGERWQDEIQGLERNMCMWRDNTENEMVGMKKALREEMQKMMDEVRIGLIRVERLLEDTENWRQGAKFLQQSKEECGTSMEGIQRKMESQVASMKVDLLFELKEKVTNGMRRDLGVFELGVSKQFEAEFLLDDGALVVACRAEHLFKVISEAYEFQFCHIWTLFLRMPLHTYIMDCDFTDPVATLIVAMFVRDLDGPLPMPFYDRRAEDIVVDIDGYEADSDMLQEPLRKSSWTLDTSGATWLIGTFTTVGDDVLDCLAGCGDMATECKRLHWHCISIEKDVVVF